MRMKSIMLTPALLISLGFAITGLVFAILGETPLAGIGIAMAAGPLPGFVLYIMATKSRARTAARLPISMTVSIVGSALAVIAYFDGSATQAALGMALAGTMIFLWYNFVYSSFGGRNSQTLRLGEALPNFTLTDHEGATVTAQELRQGPALLLFFRGNWCPLCMAQIKEIADQYKQLAQKGVTVALISPQPEVETRKLAKKFDVPFRYLVDKDLAAAKALDIDAVGGTPLGPNQSFGNDTVMPTVVATDASGKVIFLDQTDNYRVRPEPQAFLPLFDQIKAAA